MLTYATTFSGIDGWAQGLNACGWKLLWQCEKDPWCRKLLQRRFGVHCYEDITTICEHNPSPVDALIGSPPCQPHSLAGAMLGAGDIRHLYPAFRRLVALLCPRYVLMEQVWLQDEAFQEYIGGLVSLGYDITWHRLPASALGADHERPRLWIVAYADRYRIQGLIPRGDTGEDGQGREGCTPDMLATDWRTRPLLGNPRESILCRKDDGIPDWSHRIKALGNAVIPQIPYLIGQAINEIEST